MYLGNLVSVYTPKTHITTCEITSYGRHIVLSIAGQEEIVILQLVGPGVEPLETSQIYGIEENTGKIFELNEDAC